MIMRIADMMISFPGMVLAIAVAGILGGGIVNAVLALSVVSWTKYARLARSLVLKIYNRDYIEAARVTGLHHRTYSLEVHAAQCPAHDSDYRGYRYRKHDGLRRLPDFLSGLRREAPGGGMGLYAERGETLHNGGALADDFSWPGPSL